MKSWTDLHCGKPWGTRRNTHVRMFGFTFVPWSVVFLSLFEPLSQSVFFCFLDLCFFFPLYLGQQWSIMTKCCKLFPLSVLSPSPTLWCFPFTLFLSLYYLSISSVLSLSSFAVVCPMLHLQMHSLPFLISCYFLQSSCTTYFLIPSFLLAVLLSEIGMLNFALYISSNARNPNCLFPFPLSSTIYNVSVTRSWGKAS